jgi:hypothetical protein
MMVYVHAPDGRSYRAFRTVEDAMQFASKHARKVIGMRKDAVSGRIIVTFAGHIARPTCPKFRTVRVIMTNGIRLQPS